jgi:hypothetical protein
MALYTIVIPAKAGIQVEESSSKRKINKVDPFGAFLLLDPSLRWDDAGCWDRPYLWGI